MSVLPSRADLLRRVRRVLKAHPTLTANGFDLKRDPTISNLTDAGGLSEIQGALDYLDALGARIVQARANSPSSYHVKHCAERWHQSQGRGVYISNGAGIVACVLRGVPIYTGYPTSINCGVGLHRLDLKKGDVAVIKAIRAVRA